MRSLGIVCVAILYSILSYSIPASGQQPTGEIRLTVRDPSGAGMEASGKIGNRAFQTDSQGAYTFGSLPYGRYRVQVSKKGFVTQTVSIDVESATPVLRSITLSLAGAATKVDVVATTPLAGVDLPLDAVPSPVQTATGADIGDSGALDLSDFMNRRLNGVYLNEMQGNPFQPDVNYRGYTASPLLGTPQGISVYMDGVRQNQPFGDVVSWDLIPRNAIAEMTLMAGSNPMFGLNTLGGALSIQTKDGASSPGLERAGDLRQQRAQGARSRVGRRQGDGLQLVLAANAFHESGWRFDSPSDVRQGFGRARLAVGDDRSLAHDRRMRTIR